MFNCASATTSALGVERSPGRFHSSVSAKEKEDWLYRTDKSTQNWSFITYPNSSFIYKDSISMYTFIF